MLTLDARRKLCLPEAAICASTSVATPKPSSVAMRTVRNRQKGAFQAKRTVIDMRPSISLAYRVSGKDVKGSSAEWTI